MPEVVTDELERHSRIEQVGRDRMAEAAGIAGREPGSLTVPDKEILDLPLPQRTSASREERPLEIKDKGVIQVLAKQDCGRRE